MKGARFEWDEKKNEINIRKHGIDFGDAEEIFEGVTVRRRDTRKRYGEERWMALGDLHGRVVVVAYTPRGKRTRIISIRKGDRRDREIYRHKTRKR